MFKPRIGSLIKPLLAATALCAAAITLAQTAAPTVRLRATIEKIEPGSLTIKERNGELITLVLPDNTPVNEVVPIAMADIKAGSFIGTAAMAQADGSLQALEVLVTAQTKDGKPTALRILAGRNGFTPPM